MGELQERTAESFSPETDKPIAANPPAARDSSAPDNSPTDRPATPDKSAAPAQPAKKKRSRWRTFGIAILVLIVISAAIRPMLPWAVRWYVNRTLDRSLTYEGRVGDITLHLWRGAYSIDDVRLVKKTGGVPDPLFYAKRMELAVQWDGILHRKLVGQVIMERPELNFVDASEQSDGQSGAGEPWLQILEDLSPFKLNRVEIHDAAVHFHSYQDQQPVDVYLSNLQGSIENLTNINDETTPLLTTVQARGLAMDQAKFEFQMKLNPFSYRPTFDLATRLIGLDVTKTNNLARTYGQFEFKRGWFDLVIEVQAREGQMQGYVKPLFRNLKVFDLVDDLKEDDNPLQYFWQALLGVATAIFKNQSRDQFGTVIPFTGDLAQPDTNILSAVGNVLQNAFVRAYLPRLQNGTQAVGGLQFEPPSVTDPTSIGDQP